MTAQNLNVFSNVLNTYSTFLGPKTGFFVSGIQLPDTTAPVVSNVSPTDGIDILSATPVSFDLTDSYGNLLRSDVFAYFPTLGLFEVVFFGAISGSWGSRTEGFATRYTGVRSVISNGYSFTNIIRVGGWPARPVIVVGAVDAAGNQSS